MNEQGLSGEKGNAIPWPAVRVLALERAVREVAREYTSAVIKHGEMTMDGDLVNDRLRLAALMEEVGEAAEHLTYDKEGMEAASAELYHELIQVANVALTWAAYIDRYGSAGSREIAESFGAMKPKAMCTICNEEAAFCNHGPEFAAFREDDIPRRIGNSFHLMFPGVEDAR